MLTYFLLLWIQPAFAQHSEKKAQDNVTAIREVLIRSYIDGLHRNRDLEAVKAGFHPEFVMHVHDEGRLILAPLAMWLERLNLDGTKNPNTIEYSIKNIDVTDDTATAKLEVYENGAHIYTDYFGLYRFNNAWRIVNKIFYSHEVGD